MIPSREQERNKKIRSITLWGAALNIFLMVFKIASGVFIRSSALIADGVHSLSDLTTDFVVLIGVRISSKPADESHPYGHQRFETLGAQIIAVILFFISVGLMWTAGIALYNKEENFPGVLIIVVAIISVISKEIIFYKTRKVSRETESASLYANAWHHRSDSLSSIAVLIGGILALLGYGHADQWATIVVGFMIMGVAGKIFYEGLIEITEHSADKESIHSINKILSEARDISGWHALRTRKVGGELFIDVHILVDPKLSVTESHKISERIELEIKKELLKPVNILIHIEPNT
jgi:cation diffusion facilitator family transporter